MVLLRVLEDLDGLVAFSDLGMPGGIESSSGKQSKNTQQEALGIYPTCRMTIL